MVLGERHKEVLRHTLGLKKDGDDAWRNYFVASEGHSDMPVLNELLVADYMVVRDNPVGSGYLFRATDKGREAVAGVRMTPNARSEALPEAVASAEELGQQLKGR